MPAREVKENSGSALHGNIINGVLQIFVQNFILDILYIFGRMDSTRSSDLFYLFAKYSSVITNFPFCFYSNVYSLMMIMGKICRI